MNIEDIHDSFCRLESAISGELLEKSVFDAFETLYEYKNVGVDTVEISMCENLAACYINKLEERGAIMIANGTRNDSFKMMAWMRLVEAISDSGYQVPGSLKSMYETISPLSLAALFEKSS